jgi:hypothetical protein
VQHHGVVNAEILDLVFIAFWNQTLQMLPWLLTSVHTLKVTSDTLVPLIFHSWLKFTSKNFKPLQNYTFPLLFFSYSDLFC